MEEREKTGGELPPPVQTSVVLICSISTITSPASSLIIISVIFIRTEKPGWRCNEQELLSEYLDDTLKEKKRIGKTGNQSYIKLSKEIKLKK